MSNEADMFMDIAKGRFPLADTISSARFWVPNTDDGPPPMDASNNPIPIVGNYVTRPDRNFDTLQWKSWLGFLGLDHFYLRSPGTGIAKLLTLGGFGFWWAWDIIQIWTEKERILMYGLSTPFDAQTGIGQGMIYDEPATKWKYSQDTDFGTWSFATMFGFMGLDMFVLGRFWLGFRKFLIFLITMSALAPFMIVLASDGAWPAIKSAGFFGILWDIFCFMLAIGVLSMWFGNISTLFNHPDKIRKDGLPNTQTAVDALGWIKSQYLDASGNMLYDIPPEEWETIKSHYMIDKMGIIAQEMRGRFWIAYDGEVPASPVAAAPSPGVIPLTLMWRIIMNFFSWCYSIFKKAVSKVTDAADSATHIVPKEALMMLGPAGEALISAQAATHAAAQAAKGVDAATIAKDAAMAFIPGGKAAGMLSKAGGLANKLTGAAGGLADKLADAAGGAAGEAIKKAKAAAVAKAKDVAGGAVLLGGARAEPLSLEAQVMGVAVIALVAGGSLKGIVDYLMTE